MPITPLPQFEADLEEDRRQREADQPPRTIVVRHGQMRMIGEFPCDPQLRLGCGSKLVVRTHRGTEIGVKLASTCANDGCSLSVSRQQMLDYFDRSGGRDYPFTRDGKVLRVATSEDLNEQARLEAGRQAIRRDAQRRADRLGLDMRLVEAEPILGGERLTFFFTAEQRIDFRLLVRDLASEYHARIEMRQVGSRDEARITADYEKCGQHCCCKQFLKVLKPVSMRSAKVQKATLDPVKISGRCGRLMCCLRYEDQTYQELRKRLPNRKKHVGTPEGDGIVLSTQILTQLVLVKLDGTDTRIAVPVEDLTEPGLAPPPPTPPPPPSPSSTSRSRSQAKSRPSRSPASPEGEREGGRADQPRKRRRRRRKPRSGAEQRPPVVGDTQSPSPDAPATDTSKASTGNRKDADPQKKKRRRRRRRPKKPGGPENS